jgi:hypothetical protein
MKTYSVAFKSMAGHWLTDWNQYANLDDIDWKYVEKFAIENADQAYGYYYGHNSGQLTSKRCRTVLWRK